MDWYIIICWDDRAVEDVSGYPVEMSYHLDTDSQFSLIDGCNNLAGGCYWISIVLCILRFPYSSLVGGGGGVGFNMPCSCVGLWEN